MRLTALLTASKLPCLRTGALDDPDISDITFDSRAAGSGVLFVALVGATADGHDYVERAVESGAAGVFVDEGRAADFATLGVPVIAVEDTRRALGPLAAAFFGHPADALQIVGVTGTNGKTTVSFLLEAVFTHAQRPAGVLGTVNYRWPGHVVPAPNTTPESLVVQRLLARMRDDGVAAVAMEVSSHGLATHRVAGTTFDVAVFTNLSQDHLDFHQTMEEYRDAKRTLFTEFLGVSEAAGKHPTAVLNIDDAEGEALAQAALSGEIVTTSALGAPATWRCASWRQSLSGTEMLVESPVGELTVQTRLLGRFNASNVLQTLAAAFALGIRPETAIEALRDLRGVPGRLQHLGGGAHPDVFVDYAHTPDALERALEALRPLAAARLVVVFGCGGDRDRDKRPKMGAAASRLADLVVLTSDNPRSEDPARIIADIEAGMGHGAPWSSIVGRREAIRQTIVNARPDDVILIAGKGHETYQEVAGERTAFDDVAEVNRALENFP